MFKEDDNNHRSVLETLYNLSYTVTVTDLGNGYKEYKAVPKVSEGGDVDYWYDILVEIAGNKLTRIDVTYDTGVTPVVWELSYGEDATYDGQYADPVSFVACYPKSEEGTRSIKVDYAGTERKIIVSSGVQLDVPAVLGNGDFYITAENGTIVDPLAGETLPKGETFFEIANTEKEGFENIYTDVETILHWKA